MKKLLIVLFMVVIVLIIAGIAGYAFINASLKDLAESRIGPVDLALVADGSYRGMFETLPIKVTVEVDMKDHRLDDIRILRHENGKGKAAEGIVAAMFEQQRVDVDVIAGATYSSKAIQMAVSAALAGTAAR
jgi:uncharacterized protein with FMN-binding domain